jgi:hypothetical protein
MRRPILAAAALAALAGPAPAQAAFFAGTPVDGPSADIERVGDVDLARNGTGALVYVKKDGGVDHAFVSRLAGGRFQPPERVDTAFAGPASQPVVAALTGGRLAVAFVSGGAVVTVVKPSTARPWAAPVVMAPAGADPAIDLGVNGAGYVTFTVPGSGGSDVRAARLERGRSAFAPLAAPLDVDRGAAAGAGAGRSRVAVAADGSALVGWGEGTRAVARRLLGMRLSDYPQELGAGADGVDVGVQDDPGFGWAVFRQGTAVLARRLLGATFDPPVVLQASEPSGLPRLALGGRGHGYAAIAGLQSNGAYGAAIGDDAFGAGALLGGGYGVAPAPVPAVAYDGDGLIAWQQGEVAVRRTIRARQYVDRGPLVAPRPGRPALLSDPALGLPDASRGLAASADEPGNMVVAFVQGDGPTRRVVAATLDRPPGFFNGLTPSGTRTGRRPVLAWRRPSEQWGPLRYTVVVDGRRVATTTARTVRVPRRLRRGERRWWVVARDQRGQARRSSRRMLRVGRTSRR